MPGYVNGIPHATSTDRIDLWPTTSRNLAQWIDGNMLRDDDPRMTNARPPTAHTHDLGDVTGLAARLAALEYDSGLRDITALSPIITSGRLLIQRTGRTVFLIGDNFRTSEGGSSVNVIPSGVLPVGFRPLQSVWDHVLTRNGEMRRLAVSPFGWVPIYSNPAAGDQYFFNLVYTSPDASPTTLPGTPV